MCLIFISVKNHPKYKLIIAANRDEFYSRKTTPAAYWSDYPEVLGGRDLEAHGTWMAVTRDGKIGMVTNYRDLKNLNPAAPSRGHLVADYLTNGDDAAAYLKEVHLRADQYNGFNLVVGKLDDLYYYSNYQSKIRQLSDGLYGLSNHLLDTPWPKVVKGKEAIQSIVDQDDFSADDLFEAMRDEQTASDDQLPDTGLELGRERALSAMFIKTPNYGSRCSTVVTVDYEDEISFSERVYDLTTFSFKQQQFKWRRVE